MNFRRAYEEFKTLDNFGSIQNMDMNFKRLSANIDTETLLKVSMKSNYKKILKDYQYMTI